MAKTKYVVKLSETDRKELEKLIKTGTAPARSIMRANILLASDSANGKGMTVERIAQTFHTSGPTIEKTRKAFIENGIKGAVERKKRETPPVPAKIDGTVEAHILEIACSEAPDGYEKWTVRMIAEECVKRKIIVGISHTSVAAVLKKTKSSPT